MRLPLAVSLQSRDGTVSKDAKVLNGIVEAGDTPRVKKRPGNTDLGSVRSGTAHGAYYFNGQVITVHGNAADRSTTGPLANNSVGTLEDGTRTAILTSLTRSGGVAALSFSATHGIPDGASVTVSGANQTEYNKTFTAAAGSNTSLSVSYNVTGTPATPATGTITVTWSDVVAASQRYYFADNGLTSGTTGFLMIKGPYSARRLRSDWNLSSYFVWDAPAYGDSYPGQTVPGCVFLDGYYFVMDTTAKIWNSKLNTDPSSSYVSSTADAAWQATAFIKAGAESGAGVYLGKSGSTYIVALKEFSTEPFFDAGNPTPGSPLSPLVNAVTKVGCASAGSVANVDEMLVWMSQQRGKGRSVHMMQNLAQQKISTDDIDKILDADDLVTVYSYGLKLGGHTLYVLTLVTSNITLVYDFTSQSWTQWSSLTANAPASITSIIRSGNTATVTFGSAHGLSDGDPLLIAGATPSDYNGLKQVTYVSSTVVTFQVTGSPTSPATGTITGTTYAETYFKFTYYVNGGGKDLLLHESDGHLYQLSPTVYQDAGNPINLFTRTIRIDGGVLGWKRNGRLAIIADKVSDNLAVRWSDDDCTTFSAYRLADLSTTRPNLRRNGAFRRRTYETRHIGNNPLRLEALEPEIL